MCWNSDGRGGRSGIGGETTKLTEENWEKWEKELKVRYKETGRSIEKTVDIKKN